MFFDSSAMANTAFPLHVGRIPALLVSLLIPFFSQAAAVKVPAYVFPDEKSPVIAYIEVDPELDHARILDPKYEGEWYWTTWESSFYGYVGNSRVKRNGSVEVGSVIRMNPTRDSWILTRVEKGDKIRVTSRLSVSRVQIEKEIPVYYKLPIIEESGGLAAVPISPVKPVEIDAVKEVQEPTPEAAIPTTAPLSEVTPDASTSDSTPETQEDSTPTDEIEAAAAGQPETQAEITSPAIPGEAPVSVPTIVTEPGTAAGADDTAIPQAEPYQGETLPPVEPPAEITSETALESGPVTDEPTPESPSTDAPTGSSLPEPSTAEPIPPISATATSESTESPETASTIPATDPVLEEAPRISAQELANMAPPAVDLMRDFQGFLKQVPSGDPQASHFRYQLETRSGRRIVYLDIKNLLHTGFDDMIDQWISIKGLLSELPPDNVLYLDARNIRKDS